MNSLKCRHKLASRMASRTGILKKDCARLIDAMIVEMVDALKNGEGLHIPKLGKFEYYVRRGMNRRDGVTGEYIPIPPVTRVKFIPGKDIKYGTALLDWRPYVTEAQQQSPWFIDIINEDVTEEIDDEEI